MKSTLTSILLLSLLVLPCKGQETEFEHLIAKMGTIKNMPYYPELSGDSLFWAILQKGLDIVPLLIEMLDDTTMTDVVVPNTGGEYAIGDIANSALHRIIRDLPVIEIIRELDPDNGGFEYGGYWPYWAFARGGSSNRRRYKQRIRQWFDDNKANLVWEEDTMEYRTARDWKFPTNRHPAGGQYRLKQ